MKKTIGKAVALLLSLVCMLCGFVEPVYADTDGTEIQVVQPEQLEIQLGAAWAGTEFQLKTDVGIYPGTISVGEDGVLRLEIGGSSSYVLSCVNSAVPAPAPEDIVPTEEPEHSDAAPETVQDIEAQPESTGTPDPQVTNSEADTGETETHTDEKGRLTVAGIPVIHIVLFGGGLLLAIGGLVAMKIIARRKEAGSYDDDDDDY